MPSSTPGGAIAAAILAVQSEIPTLPKTATNPHFKSKFTPLDTIVEIATPIQAKHGLTFSSMPSYDKDSGAPTLRYKLTHAPSGEAIEDSMLLLLPKNDPQGQGSAITYARRYAQVAVLNLVADEDVDGNMTAAKPAAQKPAPVGASSTGTLTAAQVKKAMGQLADVDPNRVQLLLNAYGVTDLPKLTVPQVKELIAKATA